MEGDGTHFVYKHSDLVEDGNKTCGYTGTDFHNPYAVDETRKTRVSFDFYWVLFGLQFNDEKVSFYKLNS